MKLLRNFFLFQTPACCGRVKLVFIMSSCRVVILLLLTLLSTITLFNHSAHAADDTAGPIFVKEPQNRVDFSNTTGAVVECSARGNPPPEIIWVRSEDGTAVGDVPGLRQVLANGNLVFPPFRAEDYRQEVHAQVYACLAKNSVGSIRSRDVNVRAGRRDVLVGVIIGLGKVEVWFLRWLLS